MESIRKILSPRDTLIFPLFERRKENEMDGYDMIERRDPPITQTFTLLILSNISHYISIWKKKG